MDHLPSLGLTTPRRFPFLVVVERYIRPVRHFHHTEWNIGSMRVTHAERRTRVAITCFRSLQGYRRQQR